MVSRVPVLFRVATDSSHATDDRRATSDERPQAAGLLLRVGYVDIMHRAVDGVWVLWLRSVLCAHLRFFSRLIISVFINYCTKVHVGLEDRCLDVCHV